MEESRADHVEGAVKRGTWAGSSSDEGMAPATAEGLAEGASRAAGIAEGAAADEVGIGAFFRGTGAGEEDMEDATAGAPAPSLAGFPEEALDLLTQSTRDSCSICAGRNREKAFRLLDSFYPAGTILTTGPEQTFFAAGEEELILSSYRRDAPMLTLRFHTASEHLVGVDSTDYTREEWVTYLKENPGTAFDGTIQLIAHAYGDGATYLYFPSENHLQLQCKVLELSTR